MLPSERYKEHLKMKAGEKKWREERDAIFRYRKRDLEKQANGAVSMGT